MVDSYLTLAGCHRTVPSSILETLRSSGQSDPSSLRSFPRIHDYECKGKMKTVIACTLTWSRPRRFAYCVIADDGQCYYVKSLTATDCLATKVLGSRIARFCQVAGVETAQVIFNDQFVRNAHAQCKTQEEREALKAGVHFGSLYPADPEKTAMYDLLPAQFAANIRNRQDFAIMRTIDTWIGNPVPGHTIFVRQPERDFQAHFIGFGKSFSFDEPEPYVKSWNYAVAPLGSPWFWAIAVDAIETVRCISRADLELMTSDISPDWWQGANEGVVTIIDQLISRQSKLGAMMMQLRRAESGLSTVRKSVHVETAVAPSAIRLLA